MIEFANPFPAEPVPKSHGLSDFSFLDPHPLLRPFDREITKGSGVFMLEHDFGAEFTVTPRRGASYRQRVIAPWGMMSDLASIPESVQWIPGLKPWGAKLRPSLIHDLLYLLAREFGPPRRADFHFSNRVFYGLMRITNTPKRKLIFTSVESDVGWHIFSRPRRPLGELLEIWRAER